MNNISEPSFENWNGFRIERVNNSHYPALAKLLTTASHANFSTELLQKKYATDFLGRANVGYIALDGDLAVSHQVGLLIQLVHKGHTYLSIESCDSVTHPDYGKKGLWVALNERMFNQTLIENITGVFGLPNQNSYQIAVKKLGYQMGSSFKNYSIQVHSIPFYSIANLVRLRNWLTQKAEKTLRKYEIHPIPFSSFDETNYLIVNRSPAYLTYKMERGSFFIQLSDTIFWLKIRGGNLFIGDLKTTSETEFKQAIKKLKAICFRSGLKNIIFQSQEGSFEESLFAKNYKVMETMPVLYKIFNPEVPYHLLKCTYADLDTF